METEILDELAACVNLCDELERLFQQDIDEIRQAMIGEVCEQYLKEAQKAANAATALKKRTKELLSQQAALL